MKTKMFSISVISVLILSLALPFGVLAAPANDNFADASLITVLPYNNTVDTTGSTFEMMEPNPSCGSGALIKTAWFAYTPTSTGSITARSSYYYFPPVMAVYTGTMLGALTQVACGNYYPTLTFQAQAGVTYYFQLAGLYGEDGYVPFSLEVTPPPQVGIYYSPNDPNTFDNMGFSASVGDPGGVYGFTYNWTISDGTTSNQQFFNHQFAADGDYTVNLTATTADGRSGSATQAIQVRTRDITISKLSVPQTAAANQTKTINVDVKNNRYSDYVTVILTKGTVGGEQTIGILTIYVPAKASKATTFKFTYTFTADDAAVGKVTFKAVGNIVNGRDAWYADNTLIASTKVTR